MDHTLINFIYTICGVLSGSALLFILRYISPLGSCCACLVGKCGSCCWNLVHCFFINLKVREVSHLDNFKTIADYNRDTELKKVVVCPKTKTSKAEVDNSSVSFSKAEAPNNFPIATVQVHKS